MRILRLTIFALCLIAISLLVFGRLAAETPSASMTPTMLKYQLITRFGDPFFCDLDFFPVAHADQGALAHKWFSQADPASEEMHSMLIHLKMSEEGPASEAQELALYQEHKKLQAIKVEPSKGMFSFFLRTGNEGERGEAITGTISGTGEITVLKREVMNNVCPKCLAAGTRIDTPAGPVAVQDLRTGMPVWTLDAGDKRVSGVVEKMVRMPVPAGHKVIRLSLEDGRIVLASPEHPDGEGRPLLSLLPGDVMDGSRIVSVERIPYNAPYTYDLLPSGPTGAYWADGVLLSTTIARGN